MMVARTEGFTYAAEVWALSIVQGPFPVRAKPLPSNSLLHRCKADGPHTRRDGAGAQRGAGSGGRQAAPHVRLVVHPGGVPGPRALPPQRCVARPMPRTLHASGMLSVSEWNCREAAGGILESAREPSPVYPAGRVHACSRHIDASVRMPMPGCPPRGAGCRCFTAATPPWIPAWLSGERRAIGHTHDA
jgi:hypothetical protein